METVTISKRTAERCLNRLADWLEYIEGLDAETRADIIALDELINALDNGGELIADIEERQRQQHAAAMERAAAYREEQARKAEGAKND